MGRRVLPGGGSRGSGRNDFAFPWGRKIPLLFMMGGCGLLSLLVQVCQFPKQCTGTSKAVKTWGHNQPPSDPASSASRLLLRTLHEILRSHSSTPSLPLFLPVSSPPSQISSLIPPSPAQHFGLIPLMHSSHIKTPSHPRDPSLTLAGARANHSANAAAPPSPATCAGYAWSNNTDLGGGDLLMTSGDSNGECCAACGGIAACIGFAFVPTSKACWLKASIHPSSRAFPLIQPWPSQPPLLHTPPWQTALRPPP